MAEFASDAPAENDEDQLEVCVLGLGYVGLPTALLMARSHGVVGVDVDPERVATLRDGELPFDEPGLAELFDEVAPRFHVTDEVIPADAYVIATPTPLDHAVGVADLAAVRAAAESISPHLTPETLVVVESTVPPGASDQLLASVFVEAGYEPGEYRYAYCPERAIPGDTVAEMVENHRVVGCSDSAAADQIRRLYDFVDGEIHTTDPLTAEAVKLMENTHRDVAIALANEFALMAEQLGIDVHRAIELANEHPRVELMNPGPGVGGHCITTDPKLLGSNVSHDRLLSVARQVNDAMPGHAFRRVQAVIGNRTRARIAVLGAAYKGDVDDTRETPTRLFVQHARNAGHEVRVHDPYVDEFDPTPRPLVEAVTGADCTVVLTDHDAYRELDPERLTPHVERRVVVDTRAVLDRERWCNAGFRVEVLGDGADTDRRPGR